MSANFSICVGTVGTGLFASPDGGDSWVKRRREFTEIRALAWMPN